MKKVYSLLAASALALGAFAAETPVYPGGEEAMEKFITENMQYPAPAIENGVEGVVTLHVTINPDGTVGAIKIVRMIDPDLEQEAIRIVKKMPAWTPADKDGTPVVGFVDIPVKFELPGE